MECLKFVKDVFKIAFLGMQKQCYKILYELLKKSYNSNHVLLRLIEN